MNDGFTLAFGSGDVWIDPHKPRDLESLYGVLTDPRNVRLELHRFESGGVHIAAIRDYEDAGGADWDAKFQAIRSDYVRAQVARDGRGTG